MRAHPNLRLRVPMMLQYHRCYSTGGSRRQCGPSQAHNTSSTVAAELNGMSSIYVCYFAEGVQPFSDACTERLSRLLTAAQLADWAFQDRSISLSLNSALFHILGSLTHLIAICSACMLNIAFVHFARSGFPLLFLRMVLTRTSSCIDVSQFYIILPAVTAPPPRLGASSSRIFCK